MFVFLSLAFLALSLWESHDYLRYGPLGRARAEHARKQYAFVARRSSFQEITNAFGRPSIFQGAEAERVARMLAVDKEDAVAKARSCEYTVLFHLDADTTAFFFFDAQTNVVAFAVGGQ
jgi:hypothetical protein